MKIWFFLFLEFKCIKLVKYTYWYIKCCFNAKWQKCIFRVWMCARVGEIIVYISKQRSFLFPLGPSRLPPSIGLSKYKIRKVFNWFYSVRNLWTVTKSILQVEHSITLSFHFKDNLMSKKSCHFYGMFILKIGQTSCSN